MSDTNNIDRLFQEKFKDFEAIPSDKVWENIQSRMTKKEKKTYLTPFWVKFFGFAAVFLIGFSVATTFTTRFGLKNLPINTPEVRNAAFEENNASKKTSEEKNNIVSDSFKNNTNASVVITETKNSELNSKQNNSPDKNNSDQTDFNSSSKRNYSNGSLNNSTTKNKTALHNDKNKIQSKTDENTVLNSDNPEENNIKTVVKKDSDNLNKPIVSDKNSLTNSSNQIEKDGNKLNKNISSDKNNEVVSSGNNPSKNSLTNSSTQVVLNQNKVSTATEDALSENNNNLDTEFNTTNSKTKVAYESGNRYVLNKKNTDLTISSSETNKTNILNSDSNFVTSNDKMAANNAIEATRNTTIKKEVLIVLDSLVATQKKIAENGTDEKASEEKEAKDKKEKGSKWVISSSFSPIYMNLNGSGSTIDSKFTENSKSYQTSMSYGVGLKYALDNKWTVRTGVNTLNFQYSTNDIAFYYSTRNSGFEHVDENGAGNGIVIENPDSSPKNVAYNDTGIITKRYTGNISHKINYIEVPLEVTYKIINKKFGIDVIGGVSSLFLNDNRVSLVSSESTTNIGQANNLNNLHFSTNVGLGLRYNFIKTLQINVEPMFKYQINTYNGDTGNFKPYFYGVYSGISYSF